MPHFPPPENPPPSNLMQIVEDYYRNSPDWPLPYPTSLDAEVDAFMADGGCGYAEYEVKTAIVNFWRQVKAERESCPTS